MCLRFWTHMYGNGIGTLSILLMDTREGNERDLWTLSGEAGNSWYQAEVPVSSPNPFKVCKFPKFNTQSIFSVFFQIVIVGRVGKNTLGDIAVDDLSFSLGSCPSKSKIILK